MTQRTAEVQLYRAIGSVSGTAIPVVAEPEEWEEHDRKQPESDAEQDTLTELVSEIDADFRQHRIVHLRARDRESFEECDRIV